MAFRFGVLGLRALALRGFSGLGFLDSGVQGLGF